MDATKFQHHMIPVINQRSINSTTRDLGGFYISYNPLSADYGCKTTAIVLKDRVFFVLNGDHSQALIGAYDEGGIEGVISYFIENIAQANERSEHREVVGERQDLFSLTGTAIEILGQPLVDQLTLAARPPTT